MKQIILGKIRINGYLIEHRSGQNFVKRTLGITTRWKKTKYDKNRSRINKRLEDRRPFDYFYFWIKEWTV